MRHSRFLAIKYTYLDYRTQGHNYVKEKSFNVDVSSVGTGTFL